MKLLTQTAPAAENSNSYWFKRIDVAHSFYFGWQVPHSALKLCLFYYWFLLPWLSLLLPSCVCVCVLKHACACAFMRVAGISSSRRLSRGRCACVCVCMRVHVCVHMCAWWGCFVMRGWCRWHRRHSHFFFTHTHTDTHSVTEIADPHIIQPAQAAFLTSAPHCQYLDILEPSNWSSPETTTRTPSPPPPFFSLAPQNGAEGWLSTEG